MSVNEREEGTLFDTRGTRRTRRDGTRTWSTRASPIFCLWIVVVVVIACLLASGIPRLISGRRSRQEGTKKKKKKLIIRREGGGKGGRSAQGRKEAAMGFLVISLYYFLTALVGSLLVRVCYNKGKSTNMLHITLVITAVTSCWLMWAIVWLSQWKPLINPVLKAEGE